MTGTCSINALTAVVLRWQVWVIFFSSNLFPSPAHHCPQLTGKLFNKKNNSKNNWSLHPRALRYNQQIKLSLKMTISKSKLLLIQYINCTHRMNHWSGKVAAEVTGLGQKCVNHNQKVKTSEILKILKEKKSFTSQTAYTITTQLNQSVHSCFLKHHSY